MDEGSVVVAEERSREILGQGYQRAVRYAQLLREQGELRGLIGPRELDRIWVRHILNSAAVERYLPASGTVADVGSGAGLPGVVLACMRPDLSFVLVEPMQRRTEWLGEVVEELGLGNVTIVQGQAQDVHGERSFDVVTARAVASLEKLVRWTWPLVKPGGALLAMKGARAGVEVEQAEAVLRKIKAQPPVVHEVDVLGDGDVTRVVEIRR